MLGIWWKGLKGTPTAVGFTMRVVSSLLLAYADLNFVEREKVFGFHPGLVGLMPNLAVCILGSIYWKRNGDDM